MKSIITNCFLVLSLSLAVSQAQATEIPFTATIAPAHQSPSINDFTYSIEDNKISLNWSVSENESTDRFELERSRNGKNFELAALVFTTEKNGADNYKFFEKVRPGKQFYRLKIIRKDQTVSYSSVIIANK